MDTRVKPFGILTPNKDLKKRLLIKLETFIVEKDIV